MSKKVKNQPLPIKLPIGISDFKEIIEATYYFVDKTPFIQEVFTHVTKASLITRPRRFGKTLNLSMLYYFLEMGILESKHEHLFHNFKISENTDLCAQYQNKYPVIFISFKKVASPTFEGAIKQIQLLISSLYRSFKTFLYDNLDKADLKQYNLFLEKEADLEDLKDALANLRTCLQKLIEKVYL